MAELSASSVGDIITELVGRDASEFVGAVVYHEDLPVDLTVRWPEITIAASSSLSKQRLISLFDRAKLQKEGGG